MITAEMRVQMRRLVLVEHCKIETVARRFGVHHSVVRRALRDDLGLERPRPESQLEPFKPYIVRRLADLPSLSAVRLHQELRGRGFPLSLSQLRRYLIQVRPPTRSHRAYGPARRHAGHPLAPQRWLVHHRGQVPTQRIVGAGVTTCARQ